MPKFLHYSKKNFHTEGKNVGGQLCPLLQRLSLSSTAVSPEYIKQSVVYFCLSFPVSTSPCSIVLRSSRSSLMMLIRWLRPSCWRFKCWTPHQDTSQLCTDHIAEQ